MQRRQVQKCGVRVSGGTVRERRKAGGGEEKEGVESKVEQRKKNSIGYLFL